MPDLTIYEQVAAAMGAKVIATVLHDNGDGTYARQLVATMATNGHIGQVGGELVTVSVEVTRPADAGATPYTAKDAIDTSTSAPAGFVFANLARITGGSGVIVKAQLATDQKTNTARYRLHLFNAAPTYINDNSPYLTLYANVGSRVGTIDFDAAATEDPTNSTQAVSQKVGYLLPFVCAADATLYGMLETLDAFTPAGSQKYTVKLTADRN